MRPELVDAAFRRKPPNRRSENANYDESFLIDNLKSLEKDDISDFLMVRDAGPEVTILYWPKNIYPIFP